MNEEDELWQVCVCAAGEICHLPTRVCVIPVASCCLLPVVMVVIYSAAKYTLSHSHTHTRAVSSGGLSSGGRAGWASTLRGVGS